MHFPQQAYQHDSPDLASRQRVAQKRAAETVGWNDGRMAADPRSLFPGKHFISAILDALDTKTEMSGLIARRHGAYFLLDGWVLTARDLERLGAKVVG